MRVPSIREGRGGDGKQGWLGVEALRFVNELLDRPCLWMLAPHSLRNMTLTECGTCALRPLTSVGGDLIIDNNDLLVDISTGLEGLVSINGSFMVTNNNTLSTAQATALKDAIVGVSSFTISGNLVD